jgi:hypothetical protein
VNGRAAAAPLVFPVVTWTALGLSNLRLVAI